jgi:drug/metabolite transporter (DMT)-like permease
MALALPAIFAEQLSTQWEPEFIYTMIWLTLAVSMGAYSLMWLLIEDLDATQVASLFYLGPPVTMFMAWITFGDNIRLMDVVGLLVVFSGVLVTQLKKDRTNHGATERGR